MIENYLLTQDKFYSVHLMLTNQCNNRCTYCGQYADYSDDEFNLEKLKEVVQYFRRDASNTNYKFYLEGGEPTLYSKLPEFLLFLESIGESVILLTNGRVPKKHYDTVLEHLQKGTIQHIGLHVPIGKEPFSERWDGDAHDFMAHLYNKGIRSKVVFLGLLHSVTSSQRDVWYLLRWFNYFPGLFFGIEVAFPHPGPLKKSYMNYKQRLDSMKYLMRFFLFCLEKNIKIGLGGFMLCLIDHGISENPKEYELIKNHFVNKKTDMSSIIEMHILTDTTTTILCNAKDDTFISTKSVFDYGDFSLFQSSINEEIKDCYEKKASKLPQQCLDCNYLSNGCSGDHFNLITQYSHG